VKKVWFKKPKRDLKAYEEMYPVPLFVHLKHCLEIKPK
jgi:hypothetical protein